jgi:transposase InsO family protein
MISEVIKSCEACAKNVKKTAGGEVFVTSKHSNEIGAADIFFITQKENALTYIDYFTRIVKIKKIKNKGATEITRALKEIFSEHGAPRTLITDNGKEFTNSEVKQLLDSFNINHHGVAVEKHQSNGRIERFHRTLWQSPRKKYSNSKNKAKNLKKKTYRKP